MAEASRRSYPWRQPLSLLSEVCERRDEMEVRSSTATLAFLAAVRATNHQGQTPFVPRPSLSRHYGPAVLDSHARSYSLQPSGAAANAQTRTHASKTSHAAIWSAAQPVGFARSHESKNICKCQAKRGALTVINPDLDGTGAVSVAERL